MDIIRDHSNQYQTLIYVMTFPVVKACDALQSFQVHPIDGSIRKQRYSSSQCFVKGSNRDKDTCYISHKIALKMKKKRPNNDKESEVSLQLTLFGNVSKR